MNNSIGAWNVGNAVNRSVVNIEVPWKAWIRRSTGHQQVVRISSGVIVVHKPGGRLTVVRSFTVSVIVLFVVDDDIDVEAVVVFLEQHQDGQADEDASQQTPVLPHCACNIRRGDQCYVMVKE